MAYNDRTCLADLGNTGLAACLDNLGADAKLLWTTETFEFASEADAQDQSKYTDAINSRLMFPLPQFEIVEPTSEDDVIQETPLGNRLFVREGKYSGIGSILLAMCNLARIRTFNEVVGRAFIITVDGQIWGTSPDGVKFKGFLLSELHTGGLKNTDGTTKRMVDLNYQFKNPSEMNDYPAIPALTWNPLTDLTGLIDTTVSEVGTSTDGLVVLSVIRVCDSAAVIGLVEGDFTILASDGTTAMLPADTYTDNADGTYSFVFTTPVLPADTYTANLKLASAQTTGGYASATAVSFIIP